MTFGFEAHWWKRPTVERDLFDYLICLGFVTAWFDRALVSELMRKDKERRAKVSAEITTQLGG